MLKIICEIQTSSSNITLEGKNAKKVQQFISLGSTIFAKGDLKMEVITRIGNAVDTAFTKHDNILEKKT